MLDLDIDQLLVLFLLRLVLARVVADVPVVDFSGEQVLNVDGQELPGSTTDQAQLAEFVVELVRRLDGVDFDEGERWGSVDARSAWFADVEAVVAGKSYQVVVDVAEAVYGQEV